MYELNPRTHGIKILVDSSFLCIPSYKDCNPKICSLFVHWTSVWINEQKGHCIDLRGLGRGWKTNRLMVMEWTFKRKDREDISSLITLNQFPLYYYFIGVRTECGKCVNVCVCSSENQYSLCWTALVRMTKQQQ